jgi:hypothetical protein
MARQRRGAQRRAEDDLTASQAFTLCDRVATECAEASGQGDYASGYRAAGDWMKREILRLAEGRPRSFVEREIRDVEIEARTLARVVHVAEQLIVSRRGDDPASDGVRALVATLCDDANLPVPLRTRAVRGERESSTRLRNDPASA